MTLLPASVPAQTQILVEAFIVRYLSDNFTLFLSVPIVLLSSFLCVATSVTSFERVFYYPFDFLSANNQFVCPDTSLSESRLMWMWVTEWRRLINRSMDTESLFIPPIGCCDGDTLHY